MVVSWLIFWSIRVLCCAVRLVLCCGVGYELRLRCSDEKFGGCDDADVYFSLSVVGERLLLFILGVYSCKKTNVWLGV